MVALAQAIQVGTALTRALLNGIARRVYPAPIVLGQVQRDMVRDELEAAGLLTPHDDTLVIETAREQVREHGWVDLDAIVSGHFPAGRTGTEQARYALLL